MTFRGRASPCPATTVPPALDRGGAGRWRSPSGRDQAQDGELGHRAEAYGRAPRSGAGADVDPQAPTARQPGRVRVDEVDHVRPRKELAGVRVAGQLQVEAGLLGQWRD